MRKLVEGGCIYIAQPPLYKVIQKKKIRYVQTHEQMNAELMELGQQGTTLFCKADSATFDNENLRKLIALMRQIDEPLATLEKRGVELKHLSRNFATEEGLLPRFRVIIEADQHWCATREEVDRYLETEQVRRGVEFDLSDSLQDPAAEPKKDKRLEVQVEELHEIRAINNTLMQLKSFGIQLKDLIPVGIVNAEIVYPFVLKNDEGDKQLQSLRQLLPTLRKIGEQGLKVTRFKGLGEMDSEELWDTAMDPEKRTLLQVTMEDTAAADEIFRILMGDQVEPRREFIEKHALDVVDLDV
jgi:DNA gyrase subunit B